MTMHISWNKNNKPTIKPLKR